MSGFELPSTASPSGQDGNLTLEAYSDRFSSYWATTYSFEEMQEVLFELDPPPDSEVLIQSDSDSAEGTFEEIEEPPENPSFFVVYTSDYSISWERNARENEMGAGDNEVGFTSEEPQIERLIWLYDETRDSETNDQTVEKINEFFSEHVDR